MSRIPITQRGVDALREELRRLKSEERPKVIDAISEARAHGDLKENAEYHAAKEQQGFIEGRIAEIEGKLGSAQIIDVTQMENTGKVIFGTTVSLSDTETGDEKRYQIVGDDEADTSQGRISFNSPMARALIGKEVGDFAEVSAPGGIRELEILAVDYI